MEPTLDFVRGLSLGFWHKEDSYKHSKGEPNSKRNETVVAESLLDKREGDAYNHIGNPIRSTCQSSGFTTRILCEHLTGNWPGDSAQTKLQSGWMWYEVSILWWERENSIRKCEGNYGKQAGWTYVEEGNEKENEGNGHNTESRVLFRVRIFSDKRSGESDSRDKHTARAKKDQRSASKALDGRNGNPRRDEVDNTCQNGSEVTVDASRLEETSRIIEYLRTKKMENMFMLKTIREGMKRWSMTIAGFDVYKDTGSLGEEELTYSVDTRKLLGHLNKACDNQRFL